MNFQWKFLFFYTVSNRCCLAELSFFDTFIYTKNKLDAIIYIADVQIKTLQSVNLIQVTSNKLLFRCIKIYKSEYIVSCRINRSSVIMYDKEFNIAQIEMFPHKNSRKHFLPSLTLVQCSIICIAWKFTCADKSPSESQFHETKHFTVYKMHER